MHSSGNHRTETSVTPECLDHLNAGKNALASIISPKSDGSQHRSGEQLWKLLRGMLRDPNNTSGAMLGLKLSFAQRSQITIEGMTPQLRQRRDAEDKISKRCCMFLPDETWLNYWVLVQCVLLVYIAIAVPFRIGIGIDTHPWEFAFVFDVLVDIYFIVDMIIMCTTSFVDNEGYLIWKRQAVIKHYLRTWFAIDFASALPVHYLALIPGIAPDNGDLKANKVIRIVRLTKLFKLLRIARLKQIMDKYEETLFKISSSIGVSSIILIMAAVGHWMACSWYYAGSIETSATDRTGQLLEGWVFQSFGDATDMANHTAAERYAASLYFCFATMTTVGYGDISATTPAEQATAIVAMLTGSMVFSLTIGILQNIMRMNDPGGRLKTSRLTLLMEWLTARNVPTHTKERVQKYFATLYSAQTAIPWVVKGESSESARHFLLSLPEKLRRQVSRELGWNSNISSANDQSSILQEVPFFSCMDALGQQLICSRLKFWRFDRNLDGCGEFASNGEIMIEGRLGNEMYIISVGTVEISRAGRKIGVLQDGDFFGENAVMQMRNCIPQGVKRTRTASASRLSWSGGMQGCVDLFCLLNDDLDKLETLYPPIRRIMRPYRRQAAAASSMVGVGSTFKPIAKISQPRWKSSLSDQTLHEMAAAAAQYDGNLEKKLDPSADMGKRPDNSALHINFEGSDHLAEVAKLQQISSLTDVAMQQFPDTPRHSLDFADPLTETIASPRAKWMAHQAIDRGATGSLPTRTRRTLPTRAGRPLPQHVSKSCSVTKQQATITRLSAQPLSMPTLDYAVGHLHDVYFDHGESNPSRRPRRIRRQSKVEAQHSDLCSISEKGHSRLTELRHTLAGLQRQLDQVCEAAVAWKNRRHPAV